MKTKDTIKDKIRAAKLQLGDDFGDAEIVEEAIFKAGLREVVEYIEHWRNFYSPGLLKLKIPDWQWQAQVKEWGIT